jgi:signal transduction histidine kinase
MTEGFTPGALDQKLRHELNNSMMAVLSFAELIDRRGGEDPVIHDAVLKITAAVDRSRLAVDEISDELEQIASRLSSRLR